jgi:hypothetical protein
MYPGAQYMKIGPDALGAARNEFGSAKYQNGTRRPRCRLKRVWERKTSKRDRTPSVQPQTSSGTQNMKTGPDAVGTSQNESGWAKHENWNRRRRFLQKRVWEHKI